MKIGLFIGLILSVFLFTRCEDDDTELMPFWEQTDTLPSQITGLNYHVDKYLAPVGHQFTATAYYKLSSDTVYSKVLGQGEFFYVFSELSATGGRMLPRRFGFNDNKIVGMDMWLDLTMQEQAVTLLKEWIDSPSSQDRNFYQVAHSTNSLIVLTTEGRKFSVRVELK